MKNRFCLIIILIILMNIYTVNAEEEFNFKIEKIQDVTKPFQDLYKNIAIFYDEGYFYIYDLETKNKEQIIKCDPQCTGVSIFGDFITYLVEEEGYLDKIYLYDLKNKEKTEISIGSSLGNPKIYENKIVWLDNTLGGDDKKSVWVYTRNPNGDVEMHSVLSIDKDVNIIDFYNNTILLQDSGGKYFIYDLSVDNFKFFGSSVMASCEYKTMYNRFISCYHVSPINNEYILSVYDKEEKKSTQIFSKKNVNSWREFVPFWGNKILWSVDDENYLATIDNPALATSDIVPLPTTIVPLTKSEEPNLNNKEIVNISSANETQSTTKEETSLVPKKKSLFYVLLGIALAGMILASLFWYKSKAKEKHEHSHKTMVTKNDAPRKHDSLEVISVVGLTVKHGNSLILDNLNLNIQRGELVCLLGPSGTGKSTLIDVLIGRKQPTKGLIKILDKPMGEKKINEQMGFVPQHPEIYLNQTAIQNLLNSAKKWGIKDAEQKAKEILDKIGLSHRGDLPASKLSGGQQKLLSLGMELMRDIELCILDEPTTGLDPNTRNNIITILSQTTTTLHKTVFFTTHFMDDAEQCDKVIILNKGAIVAYGPPAKLEKSLPGNGKIVNLVLDNVTEGLIENIEKLPNIKKLIREGRNIRMISDTPNAVKLGQQIDTVGGTVIETRIDNATMMDVFVYYTNQRLE